MNKWLILFYHCFLHVAKSKMLPDISNVSACVAEETGSEQAKLKIIFKRISPNGTYARLTQLYQIPKGITDAKSLAGFR